MDDHSLVLALTVQELLSAGPRFAICAGGLNHFRPSGQRSYFTDCIVRTQSPRSARHPNQDPGIFPGRLELDPRCHSRVVTATFNAPQDLFGGDTFRRALTEPPFCEPLRIARSTVDLIPTALRLTRLCRRASLALLVSVAPIFAGHLHLLSYSSTQ